MVKLYQNIEAEGGAFKHENPKRKGSRFWNEGKWNTFVDPLLIDPNLTDYYKDSTFVELGCNAGIFLKMAKDKGFRNVIGLDKSRSTIKEGKRYRDMIGYDYKMLVSFMGGDFDIDELPVADLTLLSTVHYYFDMNDWIKYLDRLIYKTRYCLVVSRHLTGYTEQIHYVPSGEFNDVRLYFKDWEQVGAVYAPTQKNDPRPRELWSLLFRSPKLRREPVDNFFTGGTDRMKGAMIQLARDVVKHDTLIPEKTDYYKAWVERKKGRWRQDRIDTFVKDKIDLLYDIKHNGIKDPILAKMYGQAVDGGHRVVMAKELGYKSIITRIV